MFNGISLVIGAGEVGTSLYNVLKETYDCRLKDLEDITFADKIGVMHICIPYNDRFETVVSEYIDNYKPEVTVIHSTVPVGTSKKLGCFHSPIRGKHPNLEQGIRTFVKEIGGNMAGIGVQLEGYFKEAGIPANYEGHPAEATELAKIMSTTYYGLCIVFNKEMKKICDKYGVDFDYVYSKWNKDYNHGYGEYSKFARPVLDYMPGKIGGHCVVPNCKLEENPITQLILDFDKTYD